MSITVDEYAVNVSIVDKQIISNQNSSKIVYDITLPSPKCDIVVGNYIFEIVLNQQSIVVESEKITMIDCSTLRPTFLVSRDTDNKLKIGSDNKLYYAPEWETTQW